ncbi:MAG: hypothetical protein Q9174_004850, partial [Haloplaca sp. 1 TL-2023]
SSPGGRDAINAENVPLLGHAVTVLLNGISDGPAIQARLAACRSLRAFIANLSDDEALQSFFPGIVSCLAKVLAGGMAAKAPYKLLEACLQLLEQALLRVVADLRCASPNGTPISDDNGNRAWLEATAGQIKMALSSLTPLRYHGRLEVQDAFFSLYVSVLTDCKKSLGNCTLLILETLVVLSFKLSSEAGQKRSRQLQQILASDPNLLDVLKDVAYDWVLALPRVFGSNDEIKRRRTIEQISTAYGLLFDQSADIAALSELTITSVKSSAGVLVSQSSDRSITLLPEGSVEVGRVLRSTVSPGAVSTFPPVVTGSTGQDGMAKELQMLIAQLYESAMLPALEQSLTASLRATMGDEQIANLWLILQLLRQRSQQFAETEQWLNIPDDHLDTVMEEAYAFSLEIVEKSTYDDAFDWRLQALALEVVSLRATFQKEDFRPELIDALYPILERMGSSNAALQQHAVTCLSILSHKCGYPSAGELVVANADYLVNAVAVKLNTFDISPQASQVMLMMIRLCGSAITPFLDDLIESIFAILACYHGYPRLVESLFEVLHAIVEEAGKTSSLAIEAARESTKRQPYKRTTIQGIVARIQTIKSRKDAPLDFDESSASPPDQDVSETASPTTATEESKPSKTHTLIHTITLQTSHHLSTPSPTLRRLLLHLITSSLPTLAAQTSSTYKADTDKNTSTDFLPLLATLWPHIIRPLFPSPATSHTSLSSPSSPPSTATETDLPTLLAAIETLSTACIHGGDFLLSRIEDLFPQLQTLLTNLEKSMLHETKTLGRSRAERSLKFKTWDALVRLVVVMVTHVGITREMEDAVFEMVGGEALLRGRERVREMLEGVNPGALWLLEEEKRVRDGGDDVVGGRWKVPVVEGWDFAEVELDGSTPPTSGTKQSSPGRLLVVRFLFRLFVLRRLKPLKELLGRFANLLARGQVNILLAGLVPRFEDVVADQILLVVGCKDLVDFSDELGLLLADKMLSAAKEGLFTCEKYYLLEHARALWDLGNDVLVEDGLGKDSQSLVFALNTKFLGLLVDLDVFQGSNTTLLRFRGADNPGTELIVSAMTTTFALSIFVTLVESKLLFEIIGELLSTRFDRFFRDIDSPDVVLGAFVLIDLLSSGIDAAGEFIVTAGFKGNVTVVAFITLSVVRVAFPRTSLSIAVGLCCLSILLGLSSASLFLSLVLLALLRLIFQDEAAQLQTKVDVGALTACFAVQNNTPVAESDVGLRIFAFLAEDKSGNEPIKVVLKLGRLVRTINDPTIVAGVVVRLSAQFKAEILDNV